MRYAILSFMDYFSYLSILEQIISRISIFYLLLHLIIKHLYL